LTEHRVIQAARMSDEPDRTLLERFVRGDQDAFEQLFRRFETDVHRWVLRIVRDTAAADDVVIETFWRAYRGRGRFDPSRSFGAWIRRIATNAARNDLRKRAHVPLGTSDVDVPAPATDRALRESVLLAFRNLPVRLKLVATLALVEEQPYAEIADALDLPMGTVKSRVFRAIRTLRKELSRLGIEP